MKRLKRFFPLRNPLSYYVKSAFKAVLTLPAIVLAHLIPRSRFRVVAGAWYGTLYADNPKYFVEWILSNTDATITWIGNPEVKKRLPLHERLRFARFGSAKALWAALRAGSWVFSNHFTSDVAPGFARGRTKCIDVWHGTPLKKVGINMPRNAGFIPILALGRMYIRYMDGPYPWLVVANDRTGQILSSGFPNTFSADRTLTCGSPRNDFLLSNNHNTKLQKELRHKYSHLLGFDPTKRLVTYLPTHRKEGVGVFTFYGLSQKDSEQVSDTLENANAVLIEQHHYDTYKAGMPPANSRCSTVVRFEQKIDVDVEELLLITDVLICDYTSAYIDYCLLERPCIHFVYDINEYRDNDSGLAYDLRQVAAGPIVRTLPELLGTLSELLAHPVFRPAPRFHELIKYETGHACELLARFIGLESNK